MAQRSSEPTGSADLCVPKCPGIGDPSAFGSNAGGGRAYGPLVPFTVSDGRCKDRHEFCNQTFD